MSLLVFTLPRIMAFHVARVTDVEPGSSTRPRGVRSQESFYTSSKGTTAYSRLASPVSPRKTHRALF
jgi:hypothetical protein